MKIFFFLLSLSPLGRCFKQLIKRGYNVDDKLPTVRDLHLRKRLREIIMSVITRAANTLGFSSLKKEQEQVIGEFIDVCQLVLERASFSSRYPI